MDRTDRPQGFRAVGLIGLFYLLDGIAFGVLAGSAASQQMRVAWRLAAWVTSAIVFALHIGYERFRLRNPPLVAALHTSLAAALGAFGLAVAATVHALIAPSGSSRTLFLVALLAWPVITAVPAFVVAFAAAFLLGPRRPSEEP